MSKKITNFLSLSKNYQVLLFDVVGVIHNGINAYPEAVESINTLRSDQKIIFLSNMPRPGVQTYSKLTSLGITRTFQVLTSGDVTRSLLTTEYAQKKIYHWGSDRNHDIDAGLNLHLVDNLDLAEVVLLTAFVEPDEDESFHTEIIKKIIDHNLPVLCANPDKIAMFGDKIRKCAGSIADKIIQEGGDVKLIGKPSPFIYDQILQSLEGINPKDILMIGDTIETDVIGAKQVGIDSLLVLTGNTGNELRTRQESLADYLVKQGWENYSPTYYSDNLKGFF